MQDDVQKLIAIALDENVFTNRRAVAVEALGKTNDVRAAEALVELLGREAWVTDSEYEYHLAASASVALSRLGPVSLPFLIQVFLHETTGLKSHYIVRALTNNPAVVGNESLIDVLAASLEDSNAGYRKGAVEILRRIDTAKIDVYIVRALRDPNAGVIISALLVVKKRKIKLARDLLLELLKNSEDKLVKAHAANAISEIGDMQIVPQLHAILPTLYGYRKLSKRVEEIIEQLSG